MDLPWSFALVDLQNCLVGGWASMDMARFRYSVISTPESGYMEDDIGEYCEGDTSY